MLSRIVVVIICMFALVCASGYEYASDHARGRKSFFSRSIVKATENSIWSKMRAQFSLHTEIYIQNKHKTQVHKYVEHYQKHNDYIYKVTDDASPYLYFIVNELEKRGMPIELALLPFIESAYKPNAVSPQGALGIWQMLPSTGSQFGIRGDSWFDGHKDFAHQTTAALNYIQYLNKEFEGDWLLTIAAYNAGEGTVKKARSYNKKAESFFDLKLPEETRKFVPRFLAIAEIIRTGKEAELYLPYIENAPYFKEIQISRQIDLKQVANLAGVRFNEIKKLNPGLSSKTHPTQSIIRIPVENVVQFQANFKKLPKA